VFGHAAIAGPLIDIATLVASNGRLRAPVLFAIGDRDWCARRPPLHLLGGSFAVLRDGSVALFGDGYWQRTPDPVMERHLAAHPEDPDAPMIATRATSTRSQTTPLG
jgi:hypothetical protein